MGSFAEKHLLDQTHLTSLHCGQKIGHLGMLKWHLSFDFHISYCSDGIRSNGQNNSAFSYPIYGNDTKLRAPEDIAFAVALFIARKKGSFVSYYMVWTLEETRWTFSNATFRQKKSTTFKCFIVDDEFMMQYHGGTNFGRFAASYVTTSYYDGAPLDEYGKSFLCKTNHAKYIYQYTNS